MLHYVRLSGKTTQAVDLALGVLGNAFGGKHGAVRMIVPMVQVTWLRGKAFTG